MWEWLLSPIDPDRAHVVGVAVSWHGRSMVLAWGVLAPLAVIAARFFKILPGQDWPRTLDSQVWWRSHWMAQTLVLLLSLLGLALIFPDRNGAAGLHGWLGYAVLAGATIQVGLGIFRGSKGGPSSPAPDGSPRGDHYDMTLWRRMFEAIHKAVGYVVVLLALATIVLGLWAANAPVWMWASLSVWWVAVAVVFVSLPAARYGGRHIPGDLGRGPAPSRKPAACPGMVGPSSGRRIARATQRSAQHGSWGQRPIDYMLKDALSLGRQCRQSILVAPSYMTRCRLVRIQSSTEISSGMPIR